MSQCTKSPIILPGVMFLEDTAKSVEHEGGSSTLHSNGGTKIRSNMVLDATGHARKLVEFDKPFNPGYQVLHCSAIGKTFPLLTTFTDLLACNSLQCKSYRGHQYVPWPVGTMEGCRWTPHLHTLVPEST